MISTLSFFIIIQSILLLFMTLHDWIHLPPLTDIRAMEKHSSKRSRLINSFIFFLIVFVPLALTVFLGPTFRVNIVLVALYGILTLGTLFSWWIPYFFGSSDQHKLDFAEYKNTHHFLPARGANVVPNTLHLLLHIQIWICFGLSLFYLIKNMS